MLCQDGALCIRELYRPKPAQLIYQPSHTPTHMYVNAMKNTFHNIMLNTIKHLPERTQVTGILFHLKR